MLRQHCLRPPPSAFRPLRAAHRCCNRCFVHIVPDQTCVIKKVTRLSVRARRKRLRINKILILYFASNKIYIRYHVFRGHRSRSAPNNSTNDNNHILLLMFTHATFLFFGQIPIWSSIERIR